MTAPTILIVDPGEDQRAILTTLLREQGYRVLEAPTAERAIEVLGEHDVHLIIGEHPVRAKRGDPLCITLRDDPDTAGIPFLALTARAMPDELDSARKSHPAGVLLKPVPLHRIVAEVRTLLGSA